MLISDRIDFTTKTVERDQVEHYAVTKASAQQEDVTIVNADETNANVHSYLKTMLIDLN